MSEYTEKMISKAENHLGDSGGFVWNYWKNLPWGTDWCVGFVLWDIYAAGLKKCIYDPYKTTNPYWVPTIEEYLHNHAKHVKMADARKGDIIIMTWTGNGNNGRRIGICSRDHVGIIRKKGTSKIAYTIEGNTNGGKVAHKERPLTNVFAIYRLDLSKVKKTNAWKICDMAIKCSYPYGTKSSKYTMPNGKPKEAYRHALNKAYPNRDSWSTRPKHGRSCDVAVGTFTRASGVDKKYPRGLDEQFDYRKTEHFKKKFKVLKNPKPKQLKQGDITLQEFDSGVGHTTINLGHNRVANAHYYSDTYPIIEKRSNKVRPISRCKRYYVYRAK